MDLKDFIKETISSVASATSELQSELSEIGAVVNPPISSSDTTKYDPTDTGTAYRSIIEVDFDVAVTASDEVSGDAKVGLRVWSAEIGGSAGKSKATAQVSRVSFKLPI